MVGPFSVFLLYERIHQLNMAACTSLGLGAIFAGLGLAPAIAAGFAAAVYMLVKVVVLMRKNPVRWAIFCGPFFFFVVVAVSTMSIIYKGSPSLNLSKKSDTTTALAIVITALVAAILDTSSGSPTSTARS